MTTHGMNSAPVRRVLRLAGWNLLLLATGLALVALGGEMWLRWTVPFVREAQPHTFVPGVGVMMPPDTEIRSTNNVDFWTVSRTNRLGFLDRAQPSPRRAAESCHIAMLGDSFVVARQVPIRAKFHVLLEEMAARELPQLDITTSAYGLAGTGQIKQLPLYDKYARHLRPRLAVLVFFPNDYADNFLPWAKNEQLHLTATRNVDGGFRLHPPDPRGYSPPSPLPPLKAYLWKWMDQMGLPPSSFLLPDWLRSKSHYRHYLFLQGRPPRMHPHYRALLRQEPLPIHEEALAFTGFALDQFKERTERDGTALVVLATRLSRFDGASLAPISEMAGERGIPVIDHADYIRRQGAELRDAEWRYDRHWSPAGHRWAAEALLEYLKLNQHVCD